MSASRRPTRRAGRMNTGRRTRDSAVISQDSVNITAAVSANWITLLTTPDSVDVNARCAPSTSLLSRLTSAPVWVRVKNCNGMRCTWSYTRVRRSKMMPSPIRAEYHRWASDSSASTLARTPISTAIRTTVPPADGPARVMVLMTLPASTGVATPMPASTMTVTRNTAIDHRNGRANAATRRIVAAPTFRFPRLPSRRSEPSMLQDAIGPPIPMLMSPLRFAPGRHEAPPHRADRFARSCPRVSYPRTTLCRAQPRG
jgi:hypothetical protein